MTIQDGQIIQACDTAYGQTGKHIRKLQTFALNAQSETQKENVRVTLKAIQALCKSALEAIPEKGNKPHD